MHFNYMKTINGYLKTSAHSSSDAKDNIIIEFQLKFFKNVLYFNGANYLVLTLSSSDAALL